MHLVRGKVTGLSINHNLSRERRAEVDSLTLYRYTKLAHGFVMVGVIVTGLAINHNLLRERRAKVDGLTP